ncbi:chemotaxis response regulator CheY [bacterium]|nr:chemotaxis response regulator CheY [bacterium]
MAVNYNMKILIVDDFSTMRRIEKNILKHLGFNEIDEAGDGAEALQKLKSKKYDFIISDWNMPNMEGIDLLRAVRSDPDLKEIPFLMVTAEAEKASVLTAIKEGVSNYIVKPFTEEVIKAKIEQIFGK